MSGAAEGQRRALRRSLDFTHTKIQLQYLAKAERVHVCVRCLLKSLCSFFLLILHR